MAPRREVEKQALRAKLISSALVAGGSHQIHELQRTARFTLLLDRARSNLSTIFDEKATLLPDEDTLSVVPGLIGAYPNALFEVDERDLPDFVQHIERLRHREDFDALARLYAVKRWDPAFWEYSDRLHADHRAADPVRAGLFDFNRLGSL
jgi:hypothetical protein